MLVFWTKRLVVLAMPKTGSTSLKAAFRKHADIVFVNPPHFKHMTYARYRRHVLPMLDPEGDRPLEVMAVVREPVDWLSSWYRYRARPAIRGRPQSTADIDFSGFVRAWLDEEPPEFARVGRQSRFLDTGGDAPGVDHLFAYDALDDAVAFLCDRLSVNEELERRNVSPRDIDTTLADDVGERLRREAPEEFDLWDKLTG